MGGRNTLVSHWDRRQFLTAATAVSAASLFWGCGRGTGGHIRLFRGGKASARIRYPYAIGWVGISCAELLQSSAVEGRPRG